MVANYLWIKQSIYANVSLLCNFEDEFDIHAARDSWTSRRMFAIFKWFKLRPLKEPDRQKEDVIANIS